MKKITVTLALVLCLVLCVFAFASCSKSGTTASTTAKPTEPAATTATPTEPESTEPGETEHVHTPEADWEIESDPTCTTPGKKVRYCEECGRVAEEEILPIDPDAHDVVEWSAEPTLLNPTVEATGECAFCHQTIPKTFNYEPPIATFTPNDNQFRADKVTLGDARGDKHFYPDESNGFEGNDLFVEFSILWDESLLNLDTAKNCYIVGHMGSSDAFLYVSPVPGIADSWGQFSGAFEAAGKYQTPISDDEVTTPATMCAQSPNYSDYPNIAGTDPDKPQWGWHRVGIRIHMELLPGKTGEDKKDYFAVMTTFVDGVALFKLSNATKGLGNMVARLFTAASDGEGGVTYGDADENEVSPIIVNHTQTKPETKAYFAIDDVSVTCGKDFVMKVEKVAAPTAATYEVEEGVTVTSTIWFKLKEQS